MLALFTRSCSVTVDSVKQKIFIVPKLLFFLKKAPIVIGFEEIEQIYLDFSEENYTISHEYTNDQRTRRRWAIMVTLRDGKTVTIGEERTDHRAGETTVLAQQRSHWEALATRASEIIGKPFLSMPGVPGGPHTFVQAIEFILQRRLAQSGLNNQSVHIRRGRDLGIEIVVNGKSYGTVDEIEDEAVRKLIQAAIAEWQAPNIASR